MGMLLKWQVGKFLGIVHLCEDILAISVSLGICRKRFPQCVTDIHIIEILTGMSLVYDANVHSGSNTGLGLDNQTFRGQNQ